MKVDALGRHRSSQNKEHEMAKFAKGDKVESVKTGAKGVVDEVYGDEKYAVLFDGATNPDRVEGFQIKAANGCARNAKFKIGDRVTDGDGVYEITDVDDGIYEWKFVSGKANPSHREGGEIAWAEGKMRLANSARNAKDRFGAEINVGDTVKFLTGTWRGLEGKVMKIDGNKATVRTEEQGDVVEDLNIIRVYNSRPLASANAVVQNAINARRARNAGGYDNSWGREVDRLGDMIAKKFKEHAESYAYWIEADCGRQVDALLREAKQNKSVQPSIIAELERLRRRVNDAVAASKNLPR